MHANECILDFSRGFKATLSFLFNMVYAFTPPKEKRTMMYALEVNNRQFNVIFLAYNASFTVCNTLYLGDLFLFKMHIVSKY